MFNDWSSIDIGRLERASKVKLTNFDESYSTAECIGSGKEPYKVTANHCSCPDYKRAGNVCKHMIALAGLRGDIDIKGTIAAHKKMLETQNCKDELSRAFANYYLFNDPSMPDDEYDKLKKRYCELTGETLA